MKVVILAGGKGSRIADVDESLPKPMIPIRNQPILWHIMSCFASQSFDDFIVASGFKSAVIKRYFLEYSAINSDFEVNLGSGTIDFVNRPPVSWKIRVVDTGLETATGGRVRRLAEHLTDEVFILTYGDGLANVDVVALLDFHRRHGQLATITAVRPPARFGELGLDGQRVTTFEEKPQLRGGWINGGFFVLDRRVLDYIHSDDEMFERGPLTRLADEGRLMAFKHEGFWQCMDTRRDHEFLESLDPDSPPWLNRN
jgi:glucose-1-phosphate cytidylyltransferase